MNESQRSKRVKSECKICGDEALYSYFGVISCSSCKVFFRRNEENEKEQLKCHYDGNCEINLNTRHVCSYCRLKKCFECGMEIETTSTDLVILNKSKQFPTLNILNSDNSTLTIDEWNLLSNLTHCYDEYSRLSTDEHIMRKQNSLPAKLRLKSETLIDLTGMALDGLRLLYEKNQDFICLSSHDRSIITSKYN